MTPLDIGLLAAIAAIAVVAAAAVRRGSLPKRLAAPAGAPRILVPFSGDLDPIVLNAAIRMVSAEQAVLVTAYLLIVPLRCAEDSPLRDEVKLAMPVLEAIEHAALRAGVPVDARIEKGRTLTHALRKLWEVERFDRIVASAPADGRAGFTEKELAWLLTHAPTETVVLKPTPTGPPFRRRPAA